MTIEERIQWATKNSSYVANVIKHVWLSDLLRHVWQHYPGSKVQIYQAEVDDSGYDIVLTLNEITRHVQLKASHAQAKTSWQDIHLELERAIGGCVVWIIYDAATWNIQSYRFFGGTPENPLPTLIGFKVAKRVFPNRQGVLPLRPNVRRVPRASFVNFSTLEQLSSRLFDFSSADQDDRNS